MDHLAYDIEDFLCDVSFQRYCLGNDDADVVYWSRWIAAHPEKRPQLEKAKKLYFELNGDITDQHFSADYAVFKEAFSKRQVGYIEEEDSHEPAKVKLWSKIIVAASIVFAIGAGLWFYQTALHKGGEATIAFSTNDIKPGKNIAIMTLGNGQAINLSEAKRGVVIDAAKLSYSDGSSLEHLSEGNTINNLEKIMISTPRGGQYQVELPDGTKVWLNAASSISFPASFSGLSRRMVELSGEAYFEVTKTKIKHIPFVVTSNGQEVEVLGTHFNINAYADEGSVKTTLLEGLVRVSKKVVIHPGEQAQFANGQISTSKVDVGEVMSWKEGYFQFNNADIKAIMRQISRWYDVDVRYEGLTPELAFSGEIQKDLSIARVLKILNKSGVHFRIAGREVIVMP
ncbi:DUF4974 domain-containing protein [Pedobacter hiemivivus]|uniref:DUF4974 domain-containing protein n=1 Tax=Pedobacter hiemivivus TaxID=2530454 RepID=A0A4U1GI07_9SPHI|nr:FecR family protein [Pedobacter hiemivivus]TKC62543.1 DUF4974 domain-containing protein [Pedobacter hiemivivus]